MYGNTAYTRTLDVLNHIGGLEVIDSRQILNKGRADVLANPEDGLYIELEKPVAEEFGIPETIYLAHAPWSYEYVASGFLKLWLKEDSAVLALDFLAEKVRITTQTP